MQKEELSKSKYHATFSQLYRLDDLWQDCHKCRSEGLLFKWNFKLDCVWTELSADALDDELKKFNKFCEKIVENKKNKDILYQILMEKEIWLRRIQNKQGKGTAYLDELEDLME